MENTINNKRQINIDLAKFLAIVFMMIIHVLLSYVDDFSTGFNYIASSILGGPLSAPVFMISMGVGFAYSRSQDPIKIIKRGINILILGYLLNIIIALNVYRAIFDNAGLEVIIEEICLSFFYGDILQFAGLSMIVFGFLRKLKLNDHMILLIGILLSIISSLVPVINTDSYLLSITGGLFIPVNHSVELFMVFPLSVWFIFPAFGYWFGNRLKNINNLNKFYLIIGCISLIVSIIGIGLEAYYKAFMMSITDIEFYFMVTHDALLSIAATISIYSICHFIVKVLPDVINKFIVNVSNSLNIIYMISWIIIIFIEFIVYSFMEELSGLPLYLILIVIIIVTIYLGLIIKKAILKKLEKKPNSFVKYINA